jgi:F-type H+-transporting ATPase subunit gamma
MAKTRAIVKRRKAIRNIRKITRTMELIAAARFKKAMDRASHAEAYTRRITEMTADLAASASDVTHPLLQKRDEIKKSILLVLGSNRGLCGGYNASILREAIGRYREEKSKGVEVQAELSGKRAISYFRFQQIPAAATFTQFEDKPRFDEVEGLANRYIAAYTCGQVDRVEVVYTKFLNAARQVATLEMLLPLSPPAADGKQPKSEHGPSIQYEFLPSAANILEEILPVSFKVRLFKCFLDAAVSEQIARRVAMKAATENANDMIKNLTRLYNRARQSQITKEIAEVIGGAEALK